MGEILFEKTVEELLKEHTVKVCNNQLRTLSICSSSLATSTLYINRIYATGGGWTNLIGSRPLG